MSAAAPFFVILIVAFIVGALLRGDGEGGA
jgi:hypothetical protein